MARHDEQRIGRAIGQSVEQRARERWRWPSIATMPSSRLHIRRSCAHRTAPINANAWAIFSESALVYQIRHIVDGRCIDFDVIEQSIRYAGRIALRGGTIEIESHSDGTSSVHMLTRYKVRGFARLIPRVFIGYVVSAMHRIVIRDMQARLHGSTLTRLDPASDSHL
jgi:hypothetical protein